MTETTTHQGQAAAVAKAPRYGQWRRPRSAGIGGLGTTATLAAVGWLLVSLLVMMLHLMAGWAMMILGVLVLAPLAISSGGRNLAQVTLARLAYRHGRRKRQHQLLNGSLGPIPSGTHQLPGVLAATEMHAAVDSYGREFGLLHQRGTGHYTAVLETDAHGHELVDRETVDAWVAGWGQWLALLGQVPGLEAASVTVETTPDPGHRLGGEVRRLTSSAGPELAKQVLHDAAADFPRTAAQVRTRVALTWRSKVSANSTTRSTADMAAEIGSHLPALGKDLVLTGAGAARPMTANTLAEEVWAAYNPREAADLDAARAEENGAGLTWDSAGPSGITVEERDRYVHGSGFSTVHFMDGAPRGAVLSSVLTQLLAPHEDIHCKRICLIYRPHDPGHAAAVIENDLKHARTNASKRAVAHARDDADVRAAEQSADEEASGAGVVSFSLVATSTVLSEDNLRQADSTLHNLSATARLGLRTVYGGQSAAFATGLGIGVLPWHLATLGGLLDNR